MSRARNGRIWALARAALLLGLQAGASTHRREPPGIPLFVSEAAADTAEGEAWRDCAVVGVALDHLYAADGVFHLVLSDAAYADTMLAQPHVDPLAVLVGLDTGSYDVLRRSLGVDESAITDFARRNATPGPACSAPRSRLPIWILHRSETADSRSSLRRQRDESAIDAHYPGVVVVSRAGLSANGRQALLYVSHSCGLLCGATRLVALHRDDDGRWRVTRQQLLWVS
jgi:hypothetical protein